MDKEDLIKAVKDKIDFEEQWLLDVFLDDGNITPMDVKIAMDGIRYVLKEQGK